MKKPFATSDTIPAMTAAAPNPYLRDAVMTATAEQLHLMLYDGAIRFALQGRDAMLKKDYETMYLRLTRAQNIIIEMLNGLNYEVNAELCERMASIYNFIYRKLVDACVHRQTEDLDDAVRVLRIERETWQILVDKVNRTREGETATESTLASTSTDCFTVDG
jgi:flagellar protein FliS